MAWQQADRTGRFDPRLLCLLALPTAHALGCATDRDGYPLLGVHRAVVERGAPVLIHVRQNDVDVAILVRQESSATLHDGPGGRNGAEWIYLDPDRKTSFELCVYSAYRQTGDRGHVISRIELAKASASRRHASRAMSQAGSLWAQATQASRIAAIDLFRQVAIGNERDLDLADQAGLYLQLARVQRFQYDEALNDLGRMAGDPRRSNYIRYMAFWTMANIRNRKGEAAASRVEVEKALRIAREAERRDARSLRRDIADMTNLLGETHLTDGDFSLGEKLVRDARLMSGDDQRLLGYVHNNLGYVNLLKARRGDARRRSKHYSASLEEHFKARHYLDVVGDRPWLSIVENNLASVFESLGEMRKSREHFEEALRLIDGTDDPLRFLVLYRNLGNIYQYLGDYEKSERYLSAALGIAKRTFPLDETRLHCRLGTTERLRGRVTAAAVEHRICYDRAAQEKSAQIQAEALLELTIDYQQQGKDVLARDSIARAVALLPTIDDGDITSKVLARQSLMQQARGESAHALATVGKAIAATGGARFPTARIDALTAAMIIEAEQGRSREAQASGRLAIDAIEAMHAHLDLERLGPAWSARTQEVYGTLAEIAIAEHRKHRRPEDLWAALGVLERSRAIGLRQQFSAPPSVVRQVEQSPLLATLSDIANAHARAGAAPGGGGLPLAYYHHHDLLTLSRLAGVDNLPVPAPPTARELQRAIGRDRAVLYYFLAKDAAYLFVLEDTRIELVELGARQRIEALVAKVRQAASHRSDTLAIALRELSAAILPAKALPTTTDWILVLDGSLHAIPFGALHVGNPGAPIEPAIARHSIVIVPSLGAYFMSKPARPASDSTDLAILADPVFNSPDQDPANLIPGWTKQLRRLPWTAREAEQLRALLPPDRALVYTGSAATRDNLRSPRVRNARVLHIASHGHFDSANPDNVGLALATTRRGSTIDSGFVTLTELFMYRFNNELVVISGCDTAMGAARGGEGMMSLTRGFLAQGASHVVSTLWEVEDRAAAEFMALFYEQLVKRGSAREALRAAQWELSQRPRYRDPFFWASYVLTTVAPNDRMTFERP
jgi:CHAT domain-containing protein/tetratricopeptide (TPR) repeat protein